MKNPAWALTLIALVCFAACSKKEASDNTGPTMQRQPAVIDPATAASVSGIIKFEGSAAAPQKIDMAQDPACGNQTGVDESMVVTNGDLANVFVYVKDGLGDRYFAPPPEPVTIVQKGCRYKPHVTAAMAGQTVKFENGDQTTHNIHMMPKELRQWNESQMSSGEPIEKKFDRPEIMVPIKCNQHPWMHMYLSVLSNPFFAITDYDGKFKIHGLPPGTYTVAAVHERLGEQDVKVTVGPKETKVQDFVFRTTH